MRDRMISKIFRTMTTLISSPRAAIRSKVKDSQKSYYTKKLKSAGIWDLLVSGQADEIEIVPYDLWNIYKLIRERKPQKILEFGIGFSTLVIAKALDALACFRAHPSANRVVVDSTREFCHEPRKQLVPVRRVALRN